MAKSILRFRVPEHVAKLHFADLPRSSELSEALARLQIERLGQLSSVSLPDLRRVSEAANALALELGCLLRRAERGEFGKQTAQPGWKHEHESLWQARPGDAPGERIDIPESAIQLPLAAFPMPLRLRNMLEKLGFKQAVDLNGKEYRHFRRMNGVGAKSVEDLRALVRRIKEGPANTVQQPISGKRLRVPPCFLVPEALRSVSPYGLPISARLDGVLRRMGITQLGDLHGRELHEMYMESGCGPGTLKEMVQVIAQATSRSKASPD